MSNENATCGSYMLTPWGVTDDFFCLDSWLTQKFVGRHLVPGMMQRDLSTMIMLPQILLINFQEFILLQYIYLESNLDITLFNMQTPKNICKTT